MTKVAWWVEGYRDFDPVHSCPGWDGLEGLVLLWWVRLPPTSSVAGGSTLHGAAIMQALPVIQRTQIRLSPFCTLVTIQTLQP